MYPPSPPQTVCAATKGVTFQPHQKTNEAILWTFIEFSISSAHTLLEQPRLLPPAVLLILFLEHLKR